jgi:hypothetical protein
MAGQQKISSNNDKETQISSSDDLWDDALLLLKSDEREEIRATSSLEKNSSNVLASVLKAAEDKKNECLKKRWRIVRGDRSIIIRDLVEKISVWARKFVVCV